jgi:hypothetical protein
MPIRSITAGQRYLKKVNGPEVRLATFILQCSKNNRCQTEIRRPDGMVVASIETVVT